jgi:ABC-type antimicrobial peptide transport system permease subunit
MDSGRAPVKRDGDRIVFPAWWFWRRFSLRRVLRNPLRVVAVVLSVAIATTLCTAVVKVSFASVSSFEQSLGIGDPRSGVLLSPIGGRFELSEIRRCLTPITPYADIVAVRRESGTLQSRAGTRAVSVAGIAGYGSFLDVAGGRGDAWEISPTIRQSLNLAKGDVVSLDVGGTVLKLEVPDLSARLLRGEIVDVVVPLEKLKEDRFVDSVALTPRSGAPDTFIQGFAASLHECFGATVGVRIETYQQPLERSEQLLAAYRMNILIMAGVTLLVCGLLISQATHVALRSQLRELSILRSLGVSRTACFGTVVIEGAFLTFLGALLGGTVGYPIAVWMTGFLINTAQDIYQVSIVPFGVSYNIIQGIVVLLGITVCGGVASALSARGVLTLAPCRGTRREQVHNQPIRGSRASALAVLGVLVCVVSIGLVTFFGGVELSYLSVASVLAAAVLCSPAAIVSVARFMPYARLYLAPRLAKGSLRVAGRHFLFSGVAASLAIALMVGLSLMVSSFHGTLSRWSATRLAGDLFVSAALSGSGNEGRIESRYVEQIHSYRGFEAVVPYYETTSEVGQHSVVVGGTDISRQCARAVYTFLQGGCEEGWQTGALISESAARKLKLSLGSSFMLEGDSFSVRGIVQEFGTEAPLIIIDEQVFTRRYPAHRPKTITIDLADSQSREQARAWLEALDPKLLVIRDSGELRALVDTLFTRTFRVTESVRWIVFVLAILGIVSTGAQYVWERRREFKTACVLGVSPRVLALSVGIETGGIAVAALLTGVVAGSGIGWCLTRYINPNVFGWSLSYELAVTPFIEAATLPLVTAGISTLIALRLIRVIMQSVRMADE